MEMFNVQFMCVEIKELESDLMDLTCSGDVFTVQLLGMRCVNADDLVHVTAV